MRRRVSIGGVSLVEHYDGSHRSDQSTRFVGRHLRVAPGSVAAEIGCGTGVLAMLAARSGAARVWATDVEPAAVALLSAASGANGLPQIVARVGNLLEPVGAEERIDLVIAVMPQKPAPSAFSSRYAGGDDGADLVVAAIGAAAGPLPRGGRLVLYHHTIAAPDRVEAALAAAFSWRVVARRVRCFSIDRYLRQAPGMIEHLDRLGAAGRVRFGRRGAFLQWDTRVIEAVRR